ncbi:MAG: hypothetical protein V4812_06965 [Pseudomonadota bacterium]
MMDKEIRRETLIRAVRAVLDSPQLPVSSDPLHAGDIVFTALLEDWERLSERTQGRLLLAVAILVNYQGAADTADKTTQGIISKLMGHP